MRAYYILMGVVIAGVIASFIPLLAKDKLAVKQSLRQQLTRCGSGVGDRAITGDRILLMGGEEVVMAAIHAPQITQQSGGIISIAKSQPFGPAAQKRLDQLIKGKKLMFYCEGRRQDYRGRRVAHIFTSQKQSPLSYPLVQEGLVWVYPAARQSKLLADFYQLERQAQQQRRGIWSVDRSLMLSQGYPHLHEGRVTAVRHQGAWFYLHLQRNDGQQRQNLPLAVAEKYKKRLLARLPAAVDPSLDGFLGLTIRIKNWDEVRSSLGQSVHDQIKSGTMIITVPERIDVIKGDLKPD